MKKEKIEITNFGYYQDALYFDIKIKNKIYENNALCFGHLYSFLDTKNSLDSFDSVIESLINVQEYEQNLKKFIYKSLNK